MLLLLKSAASGVAAASLGISLGLSGIAGTTATLDIHAGLTPPESVELNIFGTPDVHFGLSGISSGFVSNSATLDSNLSLNAFGGFGSSPTLSLLLGLSGTVGGTLQGNAVAGILHGLTGALSVLPSATETILCGLTGTPTLSGGTLTPTGSVAITLTLSGQAVATATAVCGTQLNLSATGQYAILTLATQMIVSFSTDEIVTFFRKG